MENMYIKMASGQIISWVNIEDSDYTEIVRRFNDVNSKFIIYNGLMLKKSEIIGMEVAKKEAHYVQ